MFPPLEPHSEYCLSDVGVLRRRISRKGAPAAVPFPLTAPTAHAALCDDALRAVRKHDVVLIDGAQIQEGSASLPASFAGYRSRSENAQT